jgi:hypothetical protein
MIASRLLSGKTLRWLWRSLAVLLGALHTWAANTSHSMNADGVVYLDVADAYLSGGWHEAVNPVWSPLYSWILGPVVHFLQPSMRWEFAVVHWINFAIYLLALVCFEFLWRQALRWRASWAAARPGDEAQLPDWAFRSLGYAIFIWSSLCLIEIWSINPDMLLAALIYLAAGLLLRVRIGSSPRSTFALLGLVLGLAYLAKSAMFPLAFVFFIVGLISAKDRRRARVPVLLGLAVFLLVSVPWVTAISRQVGHPTIGEAGKLTYIRYVCGTPYPHWQGDVPGMGTPRHATRRIFEKPAVYEFGTPVAGTYPVSYDPSYWYEGAVARIDLARQARGILAALVFYLDLLLRQLGGLAVGLIVLYSAAALAGIRPSCRLGNWGLALVALAALGMYSLVYVEGRYIGAFVVILWADLLANLRLPDSARQRKWVTATSATMILFMLLGILAFNLEGAGRLAGPPPAGAATEARAGPPAWPGEVALELHSNGVRAGERVAVFGYAFTSFWARLARVRVAAEMLPNDAELFWSTDAATRDEILRVLAGNGVRAVVAEYVPATADTTGWRQVGRSNFYLRLIEP